MKTMKNIFYTLAVCGLSLALTSCEDMFGDFLNKQPSNELTEEEVFSDFNLVEEFHFDTYNFLRHGALRVNNSWLDAATDLAECSYSTGGVRSSFNIGNYYASGGDPELTSTWESFYRGIRKCNMVISRIGNVPQLASDSEKQHNDKVRWYTAESRFLRVWFYWELFLRYGPVPIVEDVLEPEGDLLTGYTDRPTTADFYQFLRSELESCRDSLLTYDEGTTAANAGRIIAPMAQALLSRISLYMASPRYADNEDDPSGETWVIAANDAAVFINNYGSQYRLLVADDLNDDKTPENALMNVWLWTTYNESNPETIFFRNDAPIYWASISADTPVGEGGNGGNCPSQNLIDMFDMANGMSPFLEYDETGAPVYDPTTLTPEINPESGYVDTDTTMWANRDARLKAWILYHGVAWGDDYINVITGQRDNPVGNADATPTGYYMRKYIPSAILMNNHAGNSYRNWIIIRYAEILLNYAEALNEMSGPSVDVYNVLDEIRERAGIEGSVADRGFTKAQLRNFIHKERTVELCFEEQRWWDVRRWNVAEEALARPIYGIEVADDGVTVTRKIAQQRVFEEKMYLYPIPEAEVWKSGIKNNPGW